MNLFLDYSPNTSGKGKFLNRLIPALAKIGVKTYAKHEMCDIALGISWWRTKTKLPRVLRVDGIHLQQNDKNNWKNDRIRKAIKKSSAVIYQSQYAKSKLQGKFGFRDKPSFVVFNGSNPVPHIFFEPKKIIISSAKWCHRNGYRKHKRLKAVVDVAAACKRDDVEFVVAGNVLKDCRNTSNLRFLGQLEDKKLVAQLQSASIMLYLAKYDWCPNSVVEALCANVPVICTNGHGVEELVRVCGGRVVSNNIDVSEILIAIEEMLDNPVAVNTWPVDIENIAAQYKAVFDKVLS